MTIFSDIDKVVRLVRMEMLVMLVTKLTTYNDGICIILKIRIGEWYNDFV